MQLHPTKGMWSKDVTIVSCVYCVAFRGINFPQNISKEEKYTSFMAKYKAFFYGVQKFEGPQPSFESLRSTQNKDTMPGG
jgi:hypothetical protein